MGTPQSTKCLRSRGNGLSLTDAQGPCTNFEKSSSNSAGFQIKVDGNCLDFFWNIQSFGVYDCHSGDNQKFTDNGNGLLCVKDPPGKCLKVMGAAITKPPSQGQPSGKSK